MNKLMIISFLFAILLFGCIDLGGPQEPEKNVTPPPPPPPPTPSFSISQPTGAEAILATDGLADVGIVLSTANLIIKPSGTTAKVGEGHFRVSVDGGAHTSFYSKTYTLSGVSVGNHTLTIELVNNDNTPYSPAIVKSVMIEVKPSKPPVYVPKEHTVEIRDFDYSPEDITVKATDSITWTNTGSFPRSATCFMDGKQVFDTKVLGPGESATIQMSDVLTCEYYSVTHMAMKGTVTVEPNGTE